MAVDFGRLREIVLAAASTPPEERAEKLDRECGDDRELRAAAHRLLGFDAGEPSLQRPEGRSGAIGELTPSLVATLTKLGAPASVFFDWLLERRLTRTNDSLRLPDDLGSARVDDADGDEPETPRGVEPSPEHGGDVQAGPEGERVAGYRIVRKLGEGGMGTVYLAEDVKLRRAVALKFVRPDLVGGTDALTRFIHEARAAAAIDHPNVCTVYEIGEDGEQTFISMAYVEGTTLRERISSGRLTIDETVTIGLQVADGLRRAHEKGIVHRDLKPSNVMLSTAGLVKIMDFGLARSSDRSNLTRTGARMGTIGYMSPEQMRGEPVSDRTDVWSLGVVLFEMLAGRLPFKGESDPSLAYNIVHERVTRLRAVRDDVPSALESLVERCLEKNPDDRLDAADVVRVLEALRRASGASEAARILHTRRRVRIRTGVTLALLVLLATTVGLWKGWFRDGGETTVPESHLRRVTVLPGAVSEGLLPGSVSPDGRYVALPLRHISGDWAALGVISLETGQSRHVAGPAGEVYSVGWMPDGETLLTFEYQGDRPWRERAYSDDSRSQVWLRNIVLGSSRKIYEHPSYTTALWPVAGPDGTSIAMFRGNRRAIWIMDASGENPRMIQEVPPDERLRSLAWSPTGTRVAYARVTGGSGSHVSRIETSDLDGATTVVLEDADLDPGREDGTLCWLPDGRLFFVRFTDFLLTRSELWSVRVDPATGLRRGDPERVLELEAAAISQPTASADGRRLAFYRWQAHFLPRLVELSQTSDGADAGRWASQNWPALPAAWTRDERERLFFTIETVPGNCDIYVGDMNTGLEEPVVNTSEPEVAACLTPDGSALLFWQADRLKRMPVDGGPAVDLYRSPTPVHTVWDVTERVMCSTAPASRCVLKQVEGGETAFYGFDPRDGSLEGEIARVGFRLIGPRGRCDLSPDGTRMAIVAEGSLWVLDLDDGSIENLEGDWRGSPMSICWSGDGTWLSVTGAAGEATDWMMRVGLDGASRFLWRGEPSERLLLQVSRPSPRGTRVALTTGYGETDVWMMEDF